MVWQIVFSILIVAISSFLWRVRGGLDIWKGDNVPMNKIWYAVAFAVYAGFYFNFRHYYPIMFHSLILY